MEGLALSQTRFAWMLLVAVAQGCLWGVVYDVIGCLRGQREREAKPLQASVSKIQGRMTALRRGGVIVCNFFLDTAFGLFCGISLILLLYYTNDGAFRVLALLGAMGGYGLYRATLGRLLTVLLQWLTVAVRGLMGLLTRLLRWPLRLLMRCWKRTVGRWIVGRVEKQRQKRAQRRTQRVAEAYIRAAEGGFGIMEKEK